MTHSARFARVGAMLVALLLAGCRPLQQALDRWQTAHPPFVIEEVSADPQLTFYGTTCGSDQPTDLTVTALISGRPQTVEVRYHYLLPHGAASLPVIQPMQRVGPHIYEAVITHDPAALASLFHGRNGVILYNVSAKVPQREVTVGGGMHGVWACRTP